MKKIILVLCSFACLFSLTACGGETRKVLDAQVATSLEQTTSDLVTQFLAAVDENQAQEIADQGGEYLEYVISNYFGIRANGNGMVNALNSWNSSREDLGDFVSITGMNATYDDSDKDIIVTLDIVGSKRTAQVEAIYKDDLYKTLNSLTTNINWTFGEKMEKAGLNTLLGMGTVFIVLIIISIIISLFGFIPKIQAAFKNDDDVKSSAVDNTIAQIVEKEEQNDDLEIAAVIAAAIAAAGSAGSQGGSGSSGDLVVRSIVRRPNSMWNK
ncbi:MAG: OadG family protein [Lachnospiraceae bacterium]|nr:OadG family protein [Lachnospiraceae bacterium]